MTILYAQPYDLAATGFYYDSADDFISKADVLRNDYGQPVEEFDPTGPKPTPTPQ